MTDLGRTTAALRPLTHTGIPARPRRMLAYRALPVHHEARALPQASGVHDAHQRIARMGSRESAPRSAASRLAGIAHQSSGAGDPFQRAKRAATLPGSTDARPLGGTGGANQGGRRPAGRPAARGSPRARPPRTWPPGDRRRGVRGRETGSGHVRRGQGHHRCGGGRGVALRVVLGARSATGVPLPDNFPRGHPRHDAAGVSAAAPPRPAPPRRLRRRRHRRRRQPRCARLGARPDSRHRPPLSVVRLRGVHSAGGTSDHSRRGRRHHHRPARAGGHPTYGRLDPARHLRRLSRLRVLRQHHPVRLEPGSQGL